MEGRNIFDSKPETSQPNFISSVTLIPIEAGHFNSVGMVKKGKYDVAGVKKFSKRGRDIPYISAQAVRKYIRDYLAMSMNNNHYYIRILRKTTTKDPLIIDPVEFFEDDYLGFSHPLYSNPNEDCFDERLYSAAMNRRSPFLTTGLIGLEGLTNVNETEGWVHPTEGTPLPYKAEFSTGYFFGSFSLELGRIGRFENYGDIIELDPTILKTYSNEITSYTDSTKDVFILKNQKSRQRLAIEFYYDSILNLYGGGKSTMLAESLHPAILVSCASKFAIQLPSTLFKANEIGTLSFDTSKLDQFIERWSEMLDTPIIIGYRSGTLSTSEELRLKEYCEMKKEVILTTPGGVKSQMEELL